MTYIPYSIHEKRHIFVRICVHSAHMFTYARGDEMLNQLIVFFDIFLLPKKKSTRCERNIDISYPQRI